MHILSIAMCASKQTLLGLALTSWLFLNDENPKTFFKTSAGDEGAAGALSINPSIFITLKMSLN
jgi:hypothetical protein